jgi:hypothetical protein
MQLTPDQIREAFQKLPRPVRAYLVSTKLYDLAQDFGKKYGLHVDTLGALSQSVTNMLLGFLTPAQFQAELHGIGIPDAAAASIISDLNEKVFKPLQEEMRSAPTEEADEEEPAPEPAPVFRPAPSTPQISSAPAPLMPPPSVTLPGTGTPVPPPIAPPPSPAPAPRPPAVPEPVPPPPPATPQIPQSTSPGHRPQADRTPWTPPAPKPAPGKDALHNVLKEYGVDPYREEPE